MVYRYYEVSLLDLRRNRKKKDSEICMTYYDRSTNEQRRERENVYSIRTILLHASQLTVNSVCAGYGGVDERKTLALVRSKLWHCTERCAVDCAFSDGRLHDLYERRDNGSMAFGVGLQWRQVTEYACPLSRLWTTSAYSKGTRPSLRQMPVNRMGLITIYRHECGDSSRWYSDRRWKLAAIFRTIFLAQYQSYRLRWLVVGLEVRRHGQNSAACSTSMLWAWPWVLFLGNLIHVLFKVWTV